MALSYEDSHCKKCGKADSLDWMQRGLCVKIMKPYLRVKVYKKYLLVDIVRPNLKAGCGTITSGYKLEV